jgi:hypothetical protein
MPLGCCNFVEVKVAAVWLKPVFCLQPSGLHANRTDLPNHGVCPKPLLELVLDFVVLVFVERGETLLNLFREIEVHLC